MQTKTLHKHYNERNWNQISPIIKLNPNILNNDVVKNGYESD